MVWHGSLEGLSLPIVWFIKIPLNLAYTLLHGYKQFEDSETFKQAYDLALKLIDSEDKLSLNASLIVLHNKFERAISKKQALPFNKFEERGFFKAVEKEMHLGTLNYDSSSPITAVQKDKIKSYLNFFKPCPVEDSSAVADGYFPKACPS